MRLDESGHKPARSRSASPSPPALPLSIGWHTMSRGQIGGNASRHGAPLRPARHSRPATGTHASFGWPASQSGCRSFSGHNGSVCCPPYQVLPVYEFSRRRCLSGLIFYPAAAERPSLVAVAIIRAVEFAACMGVCLLPSLPSTSGL